MQLILLCTLKSGNLKFFTMPYLICYDIENDRLRTKTSKQLGYYGLLRMQKSVFIGRLKKRHLKKLQDWLAKNIRPSLQNDDQIAILRIGSKDLENTKHVNYVPEGWDELIDPPSAIVI